MRILYLNEHPVWLYGLPWGFRHLGHEVKIVKKVSKEYLLPVMESFKPELLITVGWVHEYMRAEKRALIKKNYPKFFMSACILGDGGYNLVKKMVLTNG